MGETNGVGLGSAELAGANLILVLAWGTGTLAAFAFTAIVSALLEVIAAAAGQ